MADRNKAPMQNGGGDEEPERELTEEEKWAYMKVPDEYPQMVNWRSNLTGSVRQMLARAWDKNGVPPDQTGWKVFLKIFELNPDVLMQFGVKARSAEQLRYDDRFVAHTLRFGEACDFVVKRCPNDKAMGSVVIPYLRELGARHVKFKRKGFKTAYWDIFAEAMTECFAEWDIVTTEKTIRAKERSRAWRTFVYLMVEEVRVGFEAASTGGATDLINFPAFLTEMGGRRPDKVLEMGPLIRTGEYDPLGPIEWIKAKKLKESQDGSQADGSSTKSSVASSYATASADPASSYASHASTSKQPHDMMQQLNLHDNANWQQQPAAASTRPPAHLVRQRTSDVSSVHDVVYNAHNLSNNSDSGWSSQSRRANHHPPSVPSSLNYALRNGQRNALRSRPMSPLLINGQLSSNEPPPYAVALARRRRRQSGSLPPSSVHSGVNNRLEMVDEHYDDNAPPPYYSTLV